MKQIVAYSGGLSSFMTAWLLIENGEEVELVFTDTKTEDDDLYRFLDETTQHFGVPFHCIEDGRNIWEVFNDVRFMGNSRIDPCSRVLKRELFRNFVEKNWRPDEIVIQVGIGPQEAHRMKAIKRNWEPYTAESVLVGVEPYSQDDICSVLESIGIEPPRLYDYGFIHNNCGGFCVKTGQKQMAMLLKTFPERYRWHEEQQEMLFEKIGKRGFIRKTVAGETKYLSLKEFREMVEHGEQVEMWPQDGCGCFV